MGVYNMITPGTKTILDIGCGTGELGKKLKAEKGVEQVFGIEKNPKEVLDKIIRSDVEATRIDNFVKHFDCIIMSGILHHLRDPWTVLKVYRNYLKDDGYLVSCIPNVGHISVLRDLLKGKWEYHTEGILDVCHMKFFTLEEMIKMFVECGFEAMAIEEDICGVTPENQDFINRLAASVEVGPNFKRDSFVLQFITKWKKK